MLINLNIIKIKLKIFIFNGVYIILFSNKKN